MTGVRFIDYNDRIQANGCLNVIPIHGPSVAIGRHIANENRKGKLLS
jgi:hypothetical protein